MKTETQTNNQSETIKVIRHTQVCQKLQISSAKLFDMVATGIFPKPFKLVPGGRAAGWLERDVDKWIVERKTAFEKGAL